MVEPRYDEVTRRIHDSSIVAYLLDAVQGRLPGATVEFVQRSLGLCGVLAPVHEPISDDTGQIIDVRVSADFQHLPCRVAIPGRQEPITGDLPLPVELLRPGRWADLQAALDGFATKITALATETTNNEHRAP